MFAKEISYEGFTYSEIILGLKLVTRHPFVSKKICSWSFWMVGCKPAKGHNIKGVIYDECKYKRLVKRKLSSITQPEISFAVSVIGQLMVTRRCTTGYCVSWWNVLWKSKKQHTILNHVLRPSIELWQNEVNWSG